MLSRRFGSSRKKATHVEDAAITLYLHFYEHTGLVRCSRVLIWKNLNSECHVINNEIRRLFIVDTEELVRSEIIRKEPQPEFNKCRLIITHIGKSSFRKLKTISKSVSFVLGKKVENKDMMVLLKNLYVINTVKQNA